MLLKIISNKKKFKIIDKNTRHNFHHNHAARRQSTLLIFTHQYKQIYARIILCLESLRFESWACKLFYERCFEIWMNLLNVVEISNFGWISVWNGGFLIDFLPWNLKFFVGYNFMLCQTRPFKNFLKKILWTQGAYYSGVKAGSDVAIGLIGE